MIIYNVTSSVDESITKDWLNWMKTKHIPDLIDCGCFLKVQINKVITQADTNNTFAIFFTCINMSELHRYQVNFSSDFQKKHRLRFGNQVDSFRTILEVIEEF